jgi:hypothetical protein
MVIIRRRFNQAGLTEPPGSKRGSLPIAGSATVAIWPLPGDHLGRRPGVAIGISAHHSSTAAGAEMLRIERPTPPCGWSLALQKSEAFVLGMLGLARRRAATCPRPRSEDACRTPSRLRRIAAVR